MSSSAYGSQWYDSSGNDLHGTIWSSWMDKERHLSPNYGFKTCNNGCFSSVFGYRGRTNGDYASAFGFCAEATQCCSTAVGYCADVTYGYTNSTFIRVLELQLLVFVYQRVVVNHLQLDIKLVQLMIGHHRVVMFHRPLVSFQLLGVIVLLHLVYYQ